MPFENTNTHIVGGLIVRNGRHRGTRIPLKLPVTVIGSSDGCDVKLKAEGITDWHCVVAITPAGPTLRSWHEESTLVNGHATIATVLKHGDSLKVGPCEFRLSWFGELSPAEPEEASSALALASPAEFSLVEREQALHEQEKQLADLLESKQQQVHDLLDQLGNKRQQFLSERESIAGELAAAKKARADAEAMLKAAEKARSKHHTTYRKLVLRAKKQRLAAEKVNGDQSLKITKDWAVLDRERENFETSKAHQQADLNATKQRLQDGWQLLEDGNRRLLHDRKQLDQTFAETQKSLEQYRIELDRREQTITTAHATLESRCADLQKELIGLDRRAMHAQIAVQELEQQRTVLEANAIVPAMSVSLSKDLVPLNHRKDRTFDELMADLTARERELDSERKIIAVQKGEFDRLNGELVDQRAVLVAQFNKLAAAARLWQQSEVEHASELEHLASDLEARERIVIVREQRLLMAEDQNLKRERDLWAFRVKLEGWQAGLTAHESQWYAQRDRIDHDVEQQRERLAKWESSLQSLCQTWSELRNKERDALLAEIDGWRTDRAEYLAARADLDAEQTALARQAKLLAVKSTAVEEAAASVDPKRLKVLTKKWESHFKRFEKSWDQKLAAIGTLSSKLNTSIETLRQSMSEMTAKSIVHKGKTQDREIATLLQSNPKGESKSIAKPSKFSDRELSELRNEVERVSAVLLNTPMPSGEEVLIPLMLAKAA